MPRLYTPKPDSAVHARKQLICSRGCRCLWWCWRWWWWWWWFQDGSKRSKLRGSKRSKSRGSKRPRDPTYVHIYIYIYCIYIETIAIYGSISVGEKTWTEQWANLDEFPYRWSAMGSRTSPSIQRPLDALLHCWAVSWWCLRKKVLAQCPTCQASVQAGM